MTRRAFAAAAISMAMSCPGGAIAFSLSTNRASLYSIGARGGGSRSHFTAGGSADLDVGMEHQSSTKTALSMTANPLVGAGAGALAGCLSGGLFAGGLHAIAGEYLPTFQHDCCGVFDRERDST